MGTETEEQRCERLERALRQHSAIHRRRMRWWKHAREYLSLRRLVPGGLVRSVADIKDHYVRQKLGVAPLPDHPPWSSNWWQAERPIRFVKGGGR